MNIGPRGEGDVLDWTWVSVEDCQSEGFDCQSEGFEGEGNVPAELGKLGGGWCKGGGGVENVQ